MKPSPTIPEEDEKIHQVLSGNIKASLVTNIIYLATRLGVPPFVLAYVSLAEYGLWSYCFVMLSYLGMGVFGVTNVYIRYIAIYAYQKDYTRINHLLSTGILSISAICLFLLSVLWLTLPWILNLFEIEPAFKEKAFYLFMGTTLIFMADITIGAYSYVLQSLQKIVTEKIIWMISFTVETAFILIFLYEGMGIYSLLWAFALRTFVGLTLSFWAAKKQLPSLSLKITYFNKEMLTLFLTFGGIVQLSGLLGIMNRSIEKIFAGFFIGLEAAGLYELGEKFPVMSLNLPGSVTAVFLPAAAEFHAKGQHENILRVYLKGSRFINLLTGSLMGFMAAFSIPLIRAWLGLDPKYDIAASILTWFSFAYQMDTLTGPASNIYRAINKPSKELFYGFTRFFFVLSGTAIGFYFLGISIMTINVSVASMMVFAALCYLCFTNCFLSVNQREFFYKVLIPGILPYLIGFILWEFSQSWFEQATRLENLERFLVCLVIYLAVWIPILYWGICTFEERRKFNKYFL